MTSFSISKPHKLNCTPLCISGLKGLIIRHFLNIFLSSALETRDYSACLGLVPILILFKSIISARVGCKVY